MNSELIMIFAIFVSSMAMYEMLCRLAKLPNTNFFKRYFYLRAGKSSEALLLGGLPLAIAFLTMIISQNKNFNLAPFDFAYLLSVSLIMIYGYLDDKFELRSLVKFSAQIITSFLFSLIIANNLGVDQSSVAFILIFTVGLGVINGVNLLDGLDTMTVKISGVVLISYSFLAYTYQLDKLMMTIGGISSGLAVFYIYNRKPAKIHLGEIGGATLGLTFLYLSCELFKASINKGEGYLEATAMCLIPMTIYGVEVLVSSTRRLLKKRSPFVGDQFHIHHLLKHNKGFGIEKTTNVISLFYLINIITCGALVFLLSTSYVVASLLLSCSLTISYVLIGKKSWFNGVGTKVLLKDFFSSLKKDEIIIINSSVSDRFEIKIHKMLDDEEVEKDVA